MEGDHQRCEHREVHEVRRLDALVGWDLRDLQAMQRRCIKHVERQLQRRLQQDGHGARGELQHALQQRLDALRRQHDVVAQAPPLQLLRQASLARAATVCSGGTPHAMQPQRETHGEGPECWLQVHAAQGRHGQLHKEDAEVVNEAVGARQRQEADEMHCDKQRGDEEHIPQDAAQEQVQQKAPELECNDDDDLSRDGEEGGQARGRWASASGSR